MFISNTFTDFKTLFSDRLSAMLGDDELGAFILVLANSLQDAQLRDLLAPALQANFAVLKQAFEAGSLQAPPDDLAVFGQLLDMDIETLPLWQQRRVDPWEVVFNIMRQLRPARASKQVLDSIRQPFDDSRFHFNKPFLKPEILWQGEHAGRNLRVLYNKFPFAPWHLIIAIEPEAKRPQFMQAEDHAYIFSLAEEMAQVFPGFGVGYNSLAAGASVNHQHFQAFVREAPFAIEDARWRHHGGEQDYPLTVHAFHDVDEAWAFIDELAGRNIAFNCLYRNAVCHVVPRAFQGRVELPGWLEGAGWIDVAGLFTVSRESDLEGLDAGVITRGLQGLAASGAC